MDWIQSKSLKLAEGFMKKMVGGEFVSEMNHFFSAVGSLRSDIAKVTDIFLENMNRSTSYLLLVYPPSLDKIEDARYLMREMSKNQFSVNEFVMNRAYLNVLDQSQEPGLAQDSEELKLYNYFMEMKKRGHAQIAELKTELSNHDLTFSMIPEIKTNLESTEDIMNFVRKMDENWSVV